MSNDEFKKAEADYKAAEKRLNLLVVERAKALYPWYENYPASDNDAGYEGGTMTQESCRESALLSLREHPTVEAALKAVEDRRTVGRMVNFPPDLDQKLRIRAFRASRTKNEIIVEAVAVYFAALKNEDAFVIRPPVTPTRLKPKSVKSRSKPRSA